MAPEGNQGIIAGAEVRLADFVECLWKPFRGPRVLHRILVAVAVRLVPLAGQVAFGGYFVRVIRQTLGSGPQPLPGWTGVRTLIVDGLRILVLQFTFLLVFVPLFLAPPLILVGALFLFRSLLFENLVLFAVATLVVSLFVLPLALAMCVLLLSATLHLAVGGLRSAFAIGRQLRMLRRQWRSYLRLLVFLVLVQLPAQILTEVPLLHSMWTDFQSGSPPAYSPPDLWPPSPLVLAVTPLAVWASVVCASGLGVAGRRLGLALPGDRAPDSGPPSASGNRP